MVGNCAAYMITHQSPLAFFLSGESEPEPSLRLISFTPFTFEKKKKLVHLRVRNPM